MPFHKDVPQCDGIHLSHVEIFLAIEAAPRCEMELFETARAVLKLDSKGLRAMMNRKIVSNWVCMQMQQRKQVALD